MRSFVSAGTDVSPQVAALAAERFASYQQRIYCRTDRMFAGLMFFQYLAGLAAAFWYSPLTWHGRHSELHPHVLAAAVLGALISFVPIVAAISRPGKTSTRHLIAIGQACTSALLIHLCGGRIETHFHVFGSLAFLAFYRDWHVLITASVVVAADHFLRGVYWPESVYGLATNSWWRSWEHTAWVVFEDVFLIYSCVVSRREMKLLAWQHAELQAVNERIEQQVHERTEAAMAANRAKAEFLANISHEIRTPMTAILGYTQILLAAQTDHPRQKDRCEPLEIIQKNGEHLLTLIDDILELSDIELDRVELKHVSCSPAALVAEAVSQVEERAAHKSLVCSTYCAKNLPDKIVSDPKRIRQILNHLLSNAVKFTQRGGVRLTAGLHGPFIMFDVTDTGIGISPESREQLFQLFSQADNSAKRVHGGTGIGLVICSRLARLLGGHVQIVSSQLEAGTTFRLCIPFSEPCTQPVLSEPAVASERAVVFEGTGRSANRERAPAARREGWSKDSEAQEVCQDADDPVADGGSNVEPCAVPGESRVTAREHHGHSDLNGCHILLAEDGPDNQRLISFLLRKAGIEVTVVENGEEAIRAVLDSDRTTRPFSLILMDMQMPVLDGYSATRRLREMEYNGPIVALTAHAMQGDREKCLAAGCDDYDTKPINRTRLFETIQRNLRRFDAADRSNTDAMACP